MPAELLEQGGQARALDPRAVFELAGRAPCERGSDDPTAARLPRLARRGQSERLSGPGLADDDRDSRRIKHEPANIAACSSASVVRRSIARSTARAARLPMGSARAVSAWS